MAGSSETQLTADARDARVGQVLNAYLDRRARGEDVSEQALLAEHADIADELREHLALLVELEPDDGRIESLLRQRVLSPCADGRYLAEFGAYKITGTLGRGGMGIVLKAYEESLNRTVALKLLRPDLADDSAAVQRFEREAKAAAALHHPNIVTVHAIGRERDTHYIAMEYVTGGTLADLIREHGPLDADATRAVFRQLLEALAAAHAAGLIHRDVKSANVLVESRDQGTGNGEQGTEAARSEKASSDGATRSPFPVPRSLPLIKLADFGLARMLTAQTRLTTGDGIMGTPEYMSPEQARGDEDIDHRTDLYSAGVVLYEMLTGHTPFRAETPSAVIHRILHEEPKDPRSFQSRVDPRLAIIAGRLMAKGRRDRPPNCNAVLHLMQSANPICRLTIRRKRSYGAAAVVALAAVGVVMFIWSSVWTTAFDITAARIDAELGNVVQIRKANETEWHTFRSFDEFGDQPLVCAEAVHAASRGVVVVGLRAPVNDAGAVLLGFSQDARELWRTALHPEWDWPGCDSRARWWHVRQVVAGNLDDAPGDELLVVAQDADYYPARISLIDPLTGRVQQTFWHPGHITGLRILPNLLGDGQPGVLAWGWNNLLDKATEQSLLDEATEAHWDWVPALMVLDPRQLAGVAPPAMGTLSEQTGAAPKAYAFLDQPGGYGVRSVGLRPSDGDGQVIARSTCKWKIDHIRLTPRHSESDSDLLIQVSFLVTSDQSANGERTVFPVPAVIVDRDLNLCRLAPAHNVASEYADSEQWRRWWRRVIPSTGGS